MKVKKKETSYLKFEEVEIRDALVEDLIKAERIAGTAEGIRFALAVLSQIATFDGRQLVPEEIQRLRVKDFLELSKKLEEFGMEELAKELSCSQDTQE